MSKKIWTLLVGVAVIGAAVSAMAQERQREQPRPRRGTVAPPRDARGQGKSLDHYLISCLMTHNRAEIALSKLAQQQASSKEVKAFAEQMVKDHTASLMELQQASGGTSETPRTLPGREGTTGTPRTRDESEVRDRVGIEGQQPDRESPPARRSDDETARPNRTAGSTDSPTVGKLMQIKDEVAERCLTSAKQMLEEKSGTEFDKAYMGMQIAGHMKMVDTLAVFEHHASEDLAQTLQQSQQTAKQHLAKAKQIVHALSGDAAKSETVERPAETTKQ